MWCSFEEGSGESSSPSFQPRTEQGGVFMSQTDHSDADRPRLAKFLSLRKPKPRERPLQARIVEDLCQRAAE